MKPKNLIQNSLKESFLAIKKNKKIFFVLFILQVISLSLIFFINISYQSKMIESARAVIEYMEKQELDEDTVGKNLMLQKNPLGNDPLLISRNYADIVYNLKFLIFFTLLVFILLNGLIWFLTGSLVHKDNLKIKYFKKKFPHHLLKFGLITLSFSFLIFLFLYSALKSFLNPTAAEINNILPLFLPILILFYFMCIAFSLLNKTELKDIMKNLFKKGVKKAHIILLAYFIIISVIFAFSSSFFYLMEKNLFLLSISAVLLISTMIWSRIFLVLVVDKV